MRRFQGMVPSYCIVRSSLDDTAGAIFAGDREQFRYLLWRQIPETEERQVTFVMLNPSTADENELDPTLRRCWSFTRRWGYNRMKIVNLFAYRATDPAEMIAQGMVGAVGYHNDWFIEDSAIRAQLVVCAWGANGSFGDRDRYVRAMLRATLRNCRRGDLHCLRLTKSGAPNHPLYLPSETRPMVYGAAEVQG